LKNYIQYSLFLLLLPAFSLAQNLAINNDGSTAHPNAVLDLKGINKGLLIPRGNAATRTALNSNTAKGLLLYDTVLNSVWMHNGNGLPSGWNSLAYGTNYWQLNGVVGNEIRNTNTGGFWSANATTVDTDPGIIQPPISGSGTRMMWIPQKSAFRAGTVEGTQWDAINVGSWSFATGKNTRASGIYSTAIGNFTNAPGIFSTAMGYSTSAFGDFSTSMGSGTIADGIYSTAMGNATNADGQYSTAMGSGTFAFGVASTAIGQFTKAIGTATTAMGWGSIARSLSSAAIGSFNDSIITSNPTIWVASDPLLILGNGTSNTNRHNAMVVYKNGNMVLKNPTTVTADPVSFTVPISGAGTRMMWLPEKSAFRVGTAIGNSWDASSIGLYSFASGLGVRALAYASTAIGSYTTANGDFSTAMGNNTYATGNTSTAMGLATNATGITATAMGYGTLASGESSTAMGNGTEALGRYSMAIGNDNNASGESSFAMGYTTTAFGEGALSSGYDTKAQGNYSTTMGILTKAKAYASIAMGRENDTIAGSNPTLWVNTDPLFILGNGNGTGTLSNALVVYKNGNTDISGYTQLGKPTEGSPAIKVKKITLNTSGSQGVCTFGAHGLTQSKILSISGLATVAGGFQILPNHLQAGFQYTLNVDNANIAVCTVAGSSGSILNATVKIVVVYEE
jgi:Head domain of trimeric autotransporter adhesin